MTERDVTTRPIVMLQSNCVSWFRSSCGSDISHICGRTYNTNDIFQYKIMKGDYKSSFISK